MLKRLVSVAAVVVGLAAWVSKAHAQGIPAVPFWGYMHYSTTANAGCLSCDPSTTPPVPGTVDRPYTVRVWDITNLDSVHEVAVSYQVYNGYWRYLFSPVDGHRYKIVVYKYSNSAGACATLSCEYIVEYPSTVRQDVKMHGSGDEVPYGDGDVGPSSYTNPCNPEGVKLAWVNGVLRIRAEKPTELNLKLYDVSGKLIVEKKVSVKAGESGVELPVKGLNVLVVEGEDFTKTLKVVK